MKQPLLVVAGVTASGKTGLAIELCRRFGGEVVCADSMQIYRGMEIATAAPTREERAQAVHHLCSFLPIGESFSVADYAALARETIAEIHARGKLPVLCGGTGLYISAILDHLDFSGFSGDPALRADLKERAEREGIEPLYRQLCALDPGAAAKIHPNNRGRVLRALEVTLSTGVPMSEHQRRAKGRECPYRAFARALGYRERAGMWGRIDRRVDRMMESGLLEEARRFYERDPGPTACAAIGYKELHPYLLGECTREEAVERLKLRTRQYAKRQLTWFKRDERYAWLYVDEYDSPAQLSDRAAQLTGEALGLAPRG